jgi:PAS domain S-box-containing protein
MYNLRSIRPTIQRVCDAIGAALDADVVILTNDYYIVGGTQRYKDMIGTYLTDTLYISKAVIERKEVIMVDSPGWDPICRPCERYQCCPDKIALNSPIFVDTDVIGIISMVGTSDKQKKRLNSKDQQLLNFIANMGELVASKMLEAFSAEQISYEKQRFESLVSSIHEGIIAIDEHGDIVNVNPSAEAILHLCKEKVINRQISDVLPDSRLIEVLRLGKGFENQEYEITHSSSPSSFFLTARPILKDGNTIGVVASVRKMSEVKDLAVSMLNSKMGISFSDIIGDSLEIRETVSTALKVAQNDSTILITGESGVGKELFARAIHNASNRRNGPFLCVNCAAIPDALLESELFGYESGAFTGAAKTGKPGMLELAHGGTLFFDEIGDMPLYLQAKLLRVLQGGEVFRVGGVRPFSYNVRFVAATNKNLMDEIISGKFREDLYYRIAVIPLRIPALRKRPEDICSFVSFFLDKYCKLMNRQAMTISDDVKDLFQSYPWPGNVRQLENTIEYCVNMCSGNIITLEHLPIELRQHCSKVSGISSDLRHTRRAYDAQVIRKLLDDYGHSVKSKRQVANKLGISISTLYRLIKD